MAQTQPPTIAASPAVPTRNVKATFGAACDAFNTWLSNAVTQFAAVATNVYANAVDAYNSAVSALGSATSAQTSASTASSAATAAALTANVTTWASGTNYALYASVISPIDFRTYRRKLAGAGTTDPSADPTNWSVISNVPYGLSAPLAVMTPTAAAALNFLNVFSSAYDAYVIEFEALANGNTNSSDFFQLRLANAGVIDSGAKYFKGGNATSGDYAFLIQGVGASGKITGSISIKNANDAANSKFVSCLAGGDGSGAYSSGTVAAVYTGGAATGFQLSWNSGSNFGAQGKVRVYGVLNG